MHAIMRSTGIEPLPYGSFVDADGTTHPAEALQLWSPADLAAVGVYAVVDDPIPVGQQQTGWTLTLADGVVRRSWTLEPAPPVVIPVPSEISPKQLILGLVAAGWITPAEGVAWSQRISLPAVFEAILAMLPEAQATEARITAYAMASSLRTDTFLRMAAEASMPGATDEQVDAALDDAFRAWSQL